MIPGLRVDSLSFDFVPRNMFFDESLPRRLLTFDYNAFTANAGTDG
jgi:hypothetical protein